MKIFLIIFLTTFLSGCTILPTKQDITTKQQPTHEDIKVENLILNQTIQSPTTIIGEAKGIWFFEGVFEVKLLSSQGTEITSAIATTPDDWMTEDFIPFTVTLKYPDTGNNQGTILFIKNNPSDKPELDDKLGIPVIY